MLKQIKTHSRQERIRKQQIRNETHASMRLMQKSAPSDGHLGLALGATCLVVVCSLLVNCQQSEQASQPSMNTENVSIAGSQSSPAPMVIVATGSGRSASPPMIATNNESRGVQRSKPVNFSMVDQEFESTHSEAQVIKSWHKLNAKIQESMRSGLKAIFPQIVSMSQEAKVSGDCSGAILKWILSLRSLRSWAIEMLDATGKPTAGILRGSLTFFGNYRQCLEIRAPDDDEMEQNGDEKFAEYFRGQFCRLQLKPYLAAKPDFYRLNSSYDWLLRHNYKSYDKSLYDELAEIAVSFHFVDIQVDLCLPSICSPSDVQRAADWIAQRLELRARLMRCNSAPKLGWSASLWERVDPTIALWLALPIIIMVCSILASLVHPLMSPRAGTGSVLRVTLERLVSCSAAQSWFASMNRKHRRNIHQKEATAALVSIRTIFVLWFIVVQLSVELKFQYMRESLVLRDMLLSYWPFQILINSTWLFESLLILMAFNFGYSSWRFPKIGQLAAAAISEIMRPLPALVVIIGLTIITPVLDLGSPLWNQSVDQQALVCQTNGFLNLFFLQNLISYEKICLPHTWLLCVESQLMLLLLPLLLVIKKSHRRNPQESDLKSVKTEKDVGTNEDYENDCKLNANVHRNQLSNGDTTCLGKIAIQFALSRAGIISFALVLVGFATNFYIVYVNKLPPAWFNSFPDQAQRNVYFSLYLTKSWTHLSAFVISLIAGFLARESTKIRLSNMGPPNASEDITLESSLSSDISSSVAGGCSPNGSRSSLSRTLQNHYTVVSTTAINVEFQKIARSTSAAQGRSENSTRTKRTTKPTGSFIISWAASISLCIILFGSYSWSTSGQYPASMIIAAYDATARIIWSMSLSWLLIMVCLKPPSLLRHPLAIAMGKLSLAAYIISPYTSTLLLAVQEQALFSSFFVIFHMILGNIVVTYLVALSVEVTIGLPVKRIVSLLVRVSHDNNQTKTKIDEETTS